MYLPDMSAHFLIRFRVLSLNFRGGETHKAQVIGEETYIAQLMHLLIINSSQRMSVCYFI
jgi:hypothetical protein